MKRAGILGSVFLGAGMALTVPVLAEDAGHDYAALSFADRAAWRQCTNEETRKDHSALIARLRGGETLPGTEDLPAATVNWRGMVNVVADLQIGMIECGQQMNIRLDTLPLIRVQ